MGRSVHCRAIADFFRPQSGITLSIQGRPTKGHASRTYRRISKTLDFLSDRAKGILLLRVIHGARDLETLFSA
jgi:hypothetical protein